MSDLTALRSHFYGEVFTEESPGYDAARRPLDPGFQHVFPRVVPRCRSRSDVVEAVRYARATGERLAVRGGGHCFAGRSTTNGIVLDLSGLDGISVADDASATVGGGARLDRVYGVLHACRRTLPAGCGASVGMGGLTLGGGIGLLGRTYGLTSDQLLGAQVVLADGSVVNCGHHQAPDLFWSLRGAGGCQFGVVVSLRFGTVCEPLTTRIEVNWPNSHPQELVAAWQAWAPDAPNEVTMNLTFLADPGRPLSATLHGASTSNTDSTRDLLENFLTHLDTTARPQLRGGVPYHQLKASFPDLQSPPGHPRLRSELFSAPLTRTTIDALLDLLQEPGARGRRRLTFTAMGVAYNRLPESATAFAHRSERFILEHVGETSDPWIDSSWSAAHRDGSGRVYPNFPDPALEDWAGAYHAGNYPRLVAVKQTYDPDRLFDFPQAIGSTERQS
ncbi:MAG TPA: FAD-binding oxidoreductase [Kribbella sp.]